MDISLKELSNIIDNINNAATMSRYMNEKAEIFVNALEKSALNRDYETIDAFLTVTQNCNVRCCPEIERTAADYAAMRAFLELSFIVDALKDTRLLRLKPKEAYEIESNYGIAMSVAKKIISDRNIIIAELYKE